MRRVPIFSLLAIVLAVGLCGCARQEPVAKDSVDIERAARDAQGTVNAYSENRADETNDTLAPDAAPSDTGTAKR